MSYNDLDKISAPSRSKTKSDTTARTVIKRLWPAHLLWNSHPNNTFSVLLRSLHFRGTRFFRTNPLHDPTMKSFITASAAVLACSTFATATVFKGTVAGQNVAWFNGPDMCADKVALDGDICDVRSPCPSLPLVPVPPQPLWLFQSSCRGNICPMFR